MRGVEHRSSARITLVDRMADVAEVPGTFSLGGREPLGSTAAAVEFSLVVLIGLPHGRLDRIDDLGDLVEAGAYDRDPALARLIPWSDQRGVGAGVIAHRTPPPPRRRRRYREHQCIAASCGVRRKRWLLRSKASLDGHGVLLRGSGVRTGATTSPFRGCGMTTSLAVALAFSRLRNAVSSWIVLMSGAGKTTVVFLSTPISTRDCRLRSWSASGWAIMTSEACASSPAASASPCAAMIWARF